MSLNGIDIASYQAGMDVNKIDGDFVIIKATEGINYTNPSFNIHVKQTLMSDKKLGLYHFIRKDSDIKKQAEYFLMTSQCYIDEAMLVLDFENTTGSMIQNQSGVYLAKQWLDYVYEQTGVRPVIYMDLSCENSLDWSSVVKANYGLWIAQYNNYNKVNGYQPRDLYGNLKHWQTAIMFQYTCAGRLSGWGGDLDFDVFYGDKSAWSKYAKTNINPQKPNWVKEDKTYTLRTDVNLRVEPSKTASVIAIMPAGSIVKTDQAIIQEGYRWVRQIRKNGFAYLATGPANNTLEYVVQ